MSTIASILSIAWLVIISLILWGIIGTLVVAVWARLAPQGDIARTVRRQQDGWGNAHADIMVFTWCWPITLFLGLCAGILAIIKPVATIILKWSQK